MFLFALIYLNFCLNFTPIFIFISIWFFVLLFLFVLYIFIFVFIFGFVFVIITFNFYYNLLLQLFYMICVVPLSKNIFLVFACHFLTDMFEKYGRECPEEDIKPSLWFPCFTHQKVPSDYILARLSLELFLIS